MLMMIEYKPAFPLIQEMKRDHYSIVTYLSLKIVLEILLKAKVAPHSSIALHAKVQPQVSALGRTTPAAKTSRPKLNNGTKLILAALTP